jgi:orotate phosphoribosyltransferase
LIYTRNELLKLVHDTKALSIWNRKKGPVFWYIAGVPGPFYINTEMILGQVFASQSLEKIDAALAATAHPAARAAQLNEAILAGYESNAVYRKIVATMIARAQEEFPTGSYSFISGGERRDWLFSIPFAKEIGIKHVFLFKNGSMHCERPLKPDESSLHVSDLINNAASYVDLWLPLLEASRLKCYGTVCVISRGAAGVKNLKERGIEIAALNSIDRTFFEQSFACGLIDKEKLDEITLHFSSPEKWGDKYLFGSPDLFDIKNIDKKSFERLRSFFTNDPWTLRKNHEDFFNVIDAKINERLKNQAA